MRSVRLAAVLALALAPAGALSAQDAVDPEPPAQEADELAVPPPPEAPGQAPIAAPPPGGVPIDFVVAPLLSAAEADLAEGRIALALARTTLLAEILPEGLPHRVRADGLRLLAMQRLPTDAAAPPLDEVLAPLVAQAELDLRAGHAPIALARLDFVLAHLPLPAGPVGLRAQELRAHAARYLGAPAPPPPAAPPITASDPELAAPGPADDRRGTGEIVELYIVAAGLGALTGAYIPFVATSGVGTTSATYILTSVAGAGLLAVGVLTLDLTTRIPSGAPPAISSSIRFGLAHGALAVGLYASTSTIDDGNVMFSLGWGGGVVGAAVGLGVGLGLTPSVSEARFVESAGFWGVALGAYAAMLTELSDPTTAFALMLSGLDIGLLTGIALAALEIVAPLGRTLWMDLGFLIGSGVGALIPSLYFAYQDEPAVWSAYGAGMLLGSIAGWVLALFLTDGWEERRREQDPVVHLGISPLEGGAALTAGGTF